MKIFTSLFLSLSAVIFVSCASNPVSYSDNGQLKIDTTPKPQSATMIANGARTFEQYKRTKARVSNSQVTRVGNRIKSVVPLSNAAWEFVTFNDRTPNAFALPGGKVGVHTGILPISQNDAGLATIVAHEIAHVTLDHHGNRANTSAITGLGGAILDAALGGGYSQIINTGSQLAINLPNSRQNEIAADQVGLIYMARAGYDPREAIKFWERFAAYKQQNGGSASAPFLSTHPLDSTRISKLKEVLPAAIAEYNKSR